jgi:hypothetical protein
MVWECDSDPIPAVATEQLADERPRAFLERPLHPEWPGAALPGSRISKDKEPRAGQSRSLGLARNREAALQRGAVNTPKCHAAYVYNRPLAIQLNL